MDLKTVKIKAKEAGVASGRMGKKELIQAIQVKEGNNPCFQSDIAPVCSLTGCLWRDDCVKG